MKHPIWRGAALATVAGVALALTAVALPASAHTPSASADCYGLDVSGSNYETRPASTDQVLVSEGSPAVDAVYETRVVSPAVEEVSHLEYQFKHKFWPIVPLVKWSADPNWNADSNPSSTGFISTGETRTVVDVPAAPAVTEQVLVSEAIPAVDPVYETVTTPADETPNRVVVTIDGAVVEDAEFGQSFSGSYDFASPFVAHSWLVEFTAWNDPTGINGWTKTLSGTSVACYDNSLRPSMSHSVDCGEISLVFNNPTKYSFAFDYRVDGAAPSGPGYGTGPVYTIVNTPAGTSKTVTLPFAEDSGDHLVSYRLNLGAEQDWYLPWVDVTVDSDCELPAQPEDEVLVSAWVDTVDCEAGLLVSTRTISTTPFVLDGRVWVKGETTTVEETASRDLTDEEAAELCPVEEEPVPPVVEKPAPPAKAAAADKLAFTGPSALAGIIGGGGLAALLAGAAAITWARPRYKRALAPVDPEQVD